MPEIIGGVSYYPDHWQQDQWRRDLQNIRSSGLKCIRFGEFSWNWFEPEEGVFRFEEYDIFMDLAHELELKVILCTPTAVPPTWLLKNYPELLMMDADGRRHTGGRHMACFHNPLFKEKAGKTILKLAGHFKNHPALEGWQIDNEPTFGESASLDRIYDYSECTVRQFRSFLIEKYEHDLDRLNRCWYNNFWSRA